MSKVEPSTPDSFDNLLKKLLAAIPEVEAAAVVSVEGLPIASALSSDVDETKIAAVAAALSSLSKKAITEIQRGGFDQLYIRGSDGYLLILQASPDAVLILSADKDIRLGRFFSGTPVPGFPFILIPPNPPDGAAQVQLPRMKSPDESEIVLFCKHCGAPLDEGVSVCPNCKKKI